MFSNHVWEDVIEPLEVQGEGGSKPEPLVLSEAKFRSVVSLLRDAVELPEEALQDDAE